MIIAGRLKGDPDGSGQRVQKLYERLIIGGPIGEFKAAPLAGCVFHEGDIPFFGDINCYQVPIW